MKLPTWFLVLLPHRTDRLRVLSPIREHFALETALRFTVIATGIDFVGGIGFVFLGMFSPAFLWMAGFCFFAGVGLVLKCVGMLRRMAELDRHIP